MQEENKALVRQMVEVLQNNHELERMEEFFTPDFLNHAEPPGEAEGNAVERARAVFRGIFAAFPDFRAEIKAQMAEGDQVMTHKIFRGTHKGPFMGLAATDKAICFEVIDILRIQDGKIIEHTGVQDRLPLLRQLGLFPSPQ